MRIRDALHVLQQRSLAAVMKPHWFERISAVKEAEMKDNEQKVNLPLFKTSWTTFKDEPAPQSVQKSNHCPSGKRLLNPIYTEAQICRWIAVWKCVFVVFSGHHHEHQDKHVNVKEIHITENLQKLEAHGWKVRALVMLSPCYDGSHYYWKEKYSYVHNISGSLSTIKWWVQALSTFWPNLKSERARTREREREL